MILGGSREYQSDSFRTRIILILIIKTILDHGFEQMNRSKCQCFTYQWTYSSTSLFTRKVLTLELCLKYVILITKSTLEGLVGWVQNNEMFHFHIDRLGHSWVQQKQHTFSQNYSSLVLNFCFKVQELEGVYNISKKPLHWTSYSTHCFIVLLHLGG